MAIIEYKEGNAVYSKTFDTITMSVNMYSKFLNHAQRNFNAKLLGSLVGMKVMTSKLIPDNYILLSSGNSLIIVIQLEEKSNGKITTNQNPAPTIL